MTKSLLFTYFAFLVLFISSCVPDMTSTSDAQVSVKATKEYTSFFFEGKEIFTRDSVLVKTMNGTTASFPLTYAEGVFSASLGRFGSYSETISDRKNGALTGEVTLSIAEDEPFIVQCPFKILKKGEKPYFMIPGFLYGSNNLATSDGKQPKFDYGGEVGWPNSAKFYIRADRSTHPGVITVKDKVASIVGVKETLKDADGKVLPVEQPSRWDPGFLYNGLMLDSHLENTDVIGFQLGYENAPARYSWVMDDTPKADKHLSGWIKSAKGKTVHAETFYAFTQANKIPDYGKLLELYYEELHQAPLRRSSRSETIQKISKAILSYSWNPEIKGFNLVDETLTGADIAWTGGMQVAYPLLKAYAKNNDSTLKGIAYSYIDNMCATAMNKNASLLNEEYKDGKWNVTGWWGTREDCFNFGDKPLHSAYLNGQASYYLLKAYELEGAKQTKWLRTAQTVLETAIRNQREDGALPVFFDPKTGDGVDYDGFQPCWFVPALVLLHKHTGDKKYLIAAQKAIKHYHGHHLNGELYNTPMDIHRGVDQEGNLSFVVACVEFHKLTNDQQYLDMAIDGLSWEFSWKFPYNTAHSSEPLKSMNWSSSGGSITSNYNVSIHQMGNLITGEMYYLYQQTGSQYIKQRLHDTCVWGLGTYNTKDNDFGFGKEGQATEQFFYTDGLVLPWPGPWDGGIWTASLSWASACVLLSCSEDIPDEFFE